jgi:hypothetical protein
MPDDAAPKSFRSSAVRFGRTVSSMSFWRNAASYCPRPRLRSQTTMSIMKPKLRLGAYHRRSARERSQGENDVLAQVPVRTWVRTRRMRAPFKAAWIIPDHPAGLFSCWLFSGKASAGYFVPIHRGCFVPLTTHRTWCLVPRGNLNSAKQCHPG